MTQPAAASEPKKPFPFNPKVAAILAALLLGICIAVITTDILSPRDRSTPATTRTGATP